MGARLKLDPIHGRRSTMWDTAVGHLAEADHKTILSLAGLLILLIALSDWRISPNVNLGFLYVIPLLLAGLHLRRTAVMILAAICTILQTSISAPGWVGTPSSHVLGVLAVFFGAGLFASETGQSHRRSKRHLAEMAAETERRRSAEEQLRLLVDGSPIAILTLDQDQRIEFCNRAAEEVLRAKCRDLRGCPVSDYLPLVGEMSRYEAGVEKYRNTAQFRGTRGDGEFFLAGAWFASYESPNGRKTAVVLSDFTEDLRDYQEASAENLLRNSRVVVGSMAHEIRNFCAAIQVVQNNLRRLPGVEATEDFKALSSLAEGLTRMAVLELRAAGDGEPPTVSLPDVLDEFRIILNASCQEGGIRLIWNVPAVYPAEVSGEHYNLLHVLINLGRNSQRALASAPEKEIEVRLEEAAAYVTLFIRDSGPGIREPSRLFRPFQSASGGNGLGLFVSRALVRACEGELYHLPGQTGCTMAMKLRRHSAAAMAEDKVLEATE